MSTPSVSFYPLEQGSLDDALLFACRLTEKALQLGHRVHLLTRSDSQAQRLDELLWQFRADSFIPHHCLTGDAEESTADQRVTLGTAEQLPAERDILINLDDKIWTHHQQFNDIREIVAADDSERNLGRQRYRHYQEQGYALETKRFSSNTSNASGTSNRT